jgi:hypothetical protein
VFEDRADVGKVVEGWNCKQCSWIGKWIGETQGAENHVVLRHGGPKPDRSRLRTVGMRRDRQGGGGTDLEEEGKLRAKKVLTEECNNDNNLGKQAEEEQEGDMALWSTTRFSVSLSSRGQ